MDARARLDALVALHDLRVSSAQELAKQWERAHPGDRTLVHRLRMVADLLDLALARRAREARTSTLATDVSFRRGFGACARCEVVESFCTCGSRVSCVHCGAVRCEGEKGHD